MGWWGWGGEGPTSSATIAPIMPSNHSHSISSLYIQSRGPEMSRRSSLFCLALLASGAVGAQSLGDQLKTFGVTKALTCLVAGKQLALSPVSNKAKTAEEWKCILVGNLNRSAVIKLLGKPTHTSSGMLFYKERVLDPDTGDLHRLQVAFTQGESMPATHVAYFDEASFQDGANPFSK